MMELSPGVVDPGAGRHIHTSSVSPARSRFVPRVERRKRARHVVVYREDRLHHALRRTRDVLLSGAALLVALPILAIAALAIVLEDGGSPLFVQKRVGRFERLFTIYKLRTMRQAQCADGVSPTTSYDARITKVGRFLRKTSIDELPQLLNVFIGDMTLVGPRPEMPFIVQRYSRWQHLRHLTTPGLTGLWQVNYRSTVPLYRPEATAVDMDYIAARSHVVDFRLMVHTFYAIVKPKGAY